MKISAPGIYYDVPAKTYFGDPCQRPSFTQSIGKVLLEQSPLHAKLAHPRLTPPAEDDDAEKYDSARAIGNAAHSLMIGRGKELAEAAFNDFKTKKAQEFRDEQSAAGKSVILSKHLARATAMVSAAVAQLEIAGLHDAFRVGQGEVVMAWQEDDLWFRTMIDWMESETLCYDYKTTGRSVAPHAVPMMMAGDGWDMQAAMHERGLDALDPHHVGRRAFRFIAQENEPPYALTIWQLPESAMTMGRKKLLMARSIWEHCVRTDTWPAYPLQINFPEYPGHLETRWLQRETEHEERQSRPRQSIPSDLLFAG